MNRAYMLVILIMVSAVGSVQIHASEKYSASYSSDDYWDAIKDGAFQRAAEMVYKDILDVIVSTANDPDKIEELFAKLIAKNGQKLADIINGDGTNLEKGAEITRLIEASLSEYESLQEGSLALKLKYSFEYATMKLSWQRKLETVNCREWQVTYTCQYDPYWNVDVCNWGGYYRNVDYKLEPSYNIYRVVNGNSSLITSLNQNILDRNVTFSTSGSDWPKIIWEELTGEDDADPSIGVHYDFDSDFRPAGSTLGYRVDANYDFCDKQNYWSTEVVVDGDGDGYGDFIPNPQAEVFKRDYAWLPVIINSILL